MWILQFSYVKMDSSYMSLCRFFHVITSVLKCKCNSPQIGLVTALKLSQLFNGNVTFLKCQIYRSELWK